MAGWVGSRACGGEAGSEVRVTVKKTSETTEGSSGAHGDGRACGLTMTGVGLVGGKAFHTAGNLRLSAACFG